MSDYTAKSIKDMEAAFGGGFVKARAELGVTSFGMQVIQMPANYEDYPLHDHAESGQEEVFLALQGSGWIEIEGERVAIHADAPIEAPTVRGFVSVLVGGLNGATVEEVLGVRNDLIDRIGLPEILGMLRVRGLNGVLRRLKSEVARAAIARESSSNSKDD